MTLLHRYWRDPGPESKLAAALPKFKSQIADLMASGQWSKRDLVDAFVRLVPEFAHAETGKYLDERM